MKWIDTPPVWLAGFLVIAFLQARYASLGLTFPGNVNDLAALLLALAGFGLTMAAVIEFARARTTIIPHEVPTALIKRGIFSRSRNPIYLADMCFFLAATLYWEAFVSLPLAPVLFVILERRFIIQEEARMRRVFRSEYLEYMRGVPRWL